MKQHIDPLATRPTVALQGLGEDGQWRTSGAKEYPPRLRRAMVTAAAEEVRQRLAKDDYLFVPVGTIPAHLLGWAAVLENRSAVAHRGAHCPDYQVDRVGS